MLSIEVIELFRKSKKKQCKTYCSIPTRVTSGSTIDLITDQGAALAKAKEESKVINLDLDLTTVADQSNQAKVWQFILDCSRKKEGTWRVRPEDIIPAKGMFLRCEITYGEADSRGYYRGELKDNKRNGIGVLSFKDAVVYHGQFDNDLPNGLAVETYPGGFVYKGEFLDDERHGLGIIQSPGLAWIGYWKHGKRNGIGGRLLISHTNYK